MAKKKTRKKKTKKQQALEEKRNIRITGGILGLLSFFGGCKLGFLGVMLANVFRLFVGNAYELLAIFIAAVSLQLLIKGEYIQFKNPKKIIGSLFIALSILLFLSIWTYRDGLAKEVSIIGYFFNNLFFDIKEASTTAAVGGGLIGTLLYSGTYFLVSQVGSYLIAILIFVIGIFFAFGISLGKLLEQVNHRLTLLKEKKKAIHETRLERRLKQQEKKQQLVVENEEISNVTPNKENTEVEVTSYEDETTKSQDSREEPTLLIDHFKEELTPLLPTEKIKNKEQPKPEVKEENSGNEEPLDFEIKDEQEDLDYILPPKTLLDNGKVTDQSGEYRKIESNVRLLEQTFASFGVEAKVVKASLGPAVTKFEVQPAVGVKVSKIVSLTDDIALALAAKDVRMEAPIPGKSLIGIEVPNSTVSTVYFKEIISDNPPHPDRLLEVPLGRDISGKIIYADLAKMPHLLIAGSTGSGKSVAINGIITSILMQAKPNEVKLMMVDPKMVELNVYNGIPHLLTPVVTNPKKAAQALQKVVQEMEQRYEKFAATGVRNITGYNEFVNEHNLENGTAEPLMPFIVVIVDELADLMMVASNEVEDAIIRLAQMARAAGIHMILATQRPSVDVITGIIKANVPSRMAFAVSSGTDSRTIIDSNGAEKLLGRGDMLFLPMGENKPLRVQGAFISDHEVERVVSFVTDQRQAEYREDMMPDEVPDKEDNPFDAKDELFEEAKNLVVDMQTASVSLLQRRFRIGYNRAARIVDELEESGIVGPSEGSKPRKVLVEKEAEEIEN